MEKPKQLLEMALNSNRLFYPVQLRPIILLELPLTERRTFNRIVTRGTMGKKYPLISIITFLSASASQLNKKQDYSKSRPGLLE